MEPVLARESTDRQFLDPKRMLGVGRRSAFENMAIELLDDPVPEVAYPIRFLPGLPRGTGLEYLPFSLRNYNLDIGIDW